MKIKVALLAPRIDTADAIGNDIMGMKNSLEEKGFEVALFAEGWNVTEKVNRVELIFQFINNQNDVVIYHHAVAWERGLEIYGKIECKKIFRYHNVTPPLFFENYHAGIARSCQVGREQIEAFKKAGYHLAMPASDYNASELKMLGFDEDKIKTLYPFHLVEEFMKINPDFEVLKSAAMGLPAPRPFFLTVGRIVPNKGHLKLVKSFEYYLRHSNSRAKLVIAGGIVPGLESYYKELNGMVKEKNLQNRIVFAGKVSTPTLKSLFLSATAYVTLSDHEGFCVPLIEAMALGAPVMTSGGTALDYTGNGAILNIKSNDDALIAASMFELEYNPDFRQSLIDAGRSLYMKEYLTDKLKYKFIRIISEELDGMES